VSITKYASAAQRSTIDSSRTAIIWVFFIIYQGSGHEKFEWLQLIGFITVIFGTFLYNEILVLPFLGFNKYTKVALKAQTDEKKAPLNKDDLEDTDSYSETVQGGSAKAHSQSK